MQVFLPCDNKTEQTLRKAGIEIEYQDEYPVLPDDCDPEIAAQALAWANRPVEATPLRERVRNVVIQARH